MYLLPSTGQKWIHILVLPVLEPHVPLWGEIRDTSSHPHTLPTRFPWNAKLTQNLSPVTQNSHGLELKRVQSHRKSLLKSHPGITSNERTTNQRNEYYTLFAPLYRHEGFGLQLGTNMTVSLLDIWSRCFVTYKKRYIPCKNTATQTYLYIDI